MGIEHDDDMPKGMDGSETVNNALNNVSNKQNINVKGRVWCEMCDFTCSLSKVKKNLCIFFMCLDWGIMFPSEGAKLQHMKEESSGENK